jgi:two-component system, NtrC family, sensor kinase
MDKSKDSTIIRRVIVIDDNPDIHRDFKTILQTDESDTSEVDELETSILGRKPKTQKIIRDIYEMDYAFQGEEGVEKIRQAVSQGRPYELAFVDMRMPPGWDGLQTIEHIWEIDSCIQVIICSAYSDYTWEEVISKLGHRGSLLILEKPFDSNEISQLACTLTEKYMLSKQVFLDCDYLDEIVKQKVHELEAALANSEEASKIIDDILAEKGLPIELKDRINAIRKNSGELLSTISAVLKNPKLQPGKTN